MSTTNKKPSAADVLRVAEIVQRRGLDSVNATLRKYRLPPIVAADLETAIASVTKGETE